MTTTITTRILRGALTLAATAAMLTVAGPATANHPTPPESTVPAEVAPSPWVLRFTGEGKLVLHRDID